MSISICVGNYAQIPYSVTGLDISVYCVEELCHCIRENAFLIDVSIMNDRLVTWISKDCGLPELAKELHPLIHKKGSLSAFVTMLMDYVGLFDAEAVREVERTLKKGSGLSGIEKRKSQMDYLVKKKKYTAALRGYNELLKLWQALEEEGKEVPAAKVREAVLHNKGVAFTGLMMYKEAAQCFLQAYEIQGNKAEYQAFLAARRMELSEEEYIAFAAKQPESSDEILSLEKRMEELKKSWKEQPEYMRLQERKKRRESSEKQKYYDESEQITEALKSSYRSSVGE